MTATRGLIWGLAALALFRPDAMAAQRCDAAGAWVGAEVAAVRYPLAGVMNGVGLGIEGGIEAGATALRIGYRRLALGDGGPAPHTATGSARRGVATLGPARLCAVGHAGASMVARGEDRAVVAAGGAGLAVVPAGWTGAGVLPFVELRALAAHSAGSVLDVGVGNGGLSLGAEAGATLSARRLLVRAAVSADGFAAGLGVTPHPAFAARLALAYRF